MPAHPSPQTAMQLASELSPAGCAVSTLLTHLDVAGNFVSVQLLLEVEFPTENLGREHDTHSVRDVSP